MTRHFERYTEALTALRDADATVEQALREAHSAGASELRREQSSRDRVEHSIERARADFDRVRLTADQLQRRSSVSIRVQSPPPPPETWDGLTSMISGIGEDCSSVAKELDWLDRESRRAPISQPVSAVDTDEFQPIAAPLSSHTPTSHNDSSRALRMAVIAAAVLIVLVIVVLVIYL